MNSVGFVAWLVTARALGLTPTSSRLALTYDRYTVPVVRAAESPGGAAVRPVLPGHRRTLNGSSRHELSTGDGGPTPWTSPRSLALRSKGRR